ncbi:MAG: 4Fe-4S binding protein [Pelolinea sp.]|nr:4Fe-4S binding protein [Pelolinea sp.]
MEVQVNKELCDGCGNCISICPAGAISLVNGIAEIDKSVCTLCQKCVKDCPVGAISIVKLPQIVEKKSIQFSENLEVIEAEPISSSAQHSIFSIVAYMGSKMIPRLIDLFLSKYEQRSREKLKPIDNHLHKNIKPQSNSGRQRHHRQGKVGRRK